MSSTAGAFTLAKIRTLSLNEYIVLIITPASFFSVFFFENSVGSTLHIFWIQVRERVEPVSKKCAKSM